MSITIGRYPEQDTTEYGGWIEDDDSTWIVYLDKNDKPLVYYASRDDLGGVTSEPVRL